MNPPFDEPSSVAFDGDRMIVTNDAYFSGDSTHWAIFDVFAGEPGAPLYVPPASLTPGTSLAQGRAPRRSRYRLRVGLRVAHSGVAHHYRFTALQLRRGRWRALPRALIVFAGKRVRTDRRGRATILVTLSRRGRYAAKLERGRRTVARAFVRVTATGQWF